MQSFPLYDKLPFACCSNELVFFPSPNCKTGRRHRQPQYFDTPFALSASGESTRGRRDLRHAAEGGGGGGGGGSSVAGSLRGSGRTAGKRMRVRVGLTPLLLFSCHRPVGFFLVLSSLTAVSPDHFSYPRSMKPYASS